MTASRKLINLFRSGDLGFIAVVIVSYLSAIATAGYAPRAFTPFRLALLTCAGLAYVVAGTYWFSRCRRNRSARANGHTVNVTTTVTNGTSLPSSIVV
jgi:hypothetical protein